MCVERVWSVWSVWSGEDERCVCGARGAWSRERTQGHNDQVGAAARRVTSANQQLLVSIFFSATRQAVSPEKCFKLLLHPGSCALAQDFGVSL